jgi:precorrin-3B methylase
MVKVVAEGESFDFDEKVNGLTNYFKDLKEFEGDKDSFELKTIKKVDVSRVLEACKTANYEFKDVNKVSGSDANAYIG